MTKTFEKDLNEKLNSEKVPMYITQKGCSLTRKTFIETNWLFANYGNYQSDEEFQELLDKYSNLNDNYEKKVIKSSKLESKIVGLKSQLQQQALPVVPECVGIWIKKCQELNWMITDVLAPESWSSDFAQDTENWLKKSKENFNLLALAFITGKYQVEKQQLFYLKHIDMSKRNSINDLYLKKYIHADLTENGEHRLSHAMSAKGIYPPKEYCAFTQQEIDSMETGSYEQIKVEEEK